MIDPSSHDFVDHPRHFSSDFVPPRLNTTVATEKIILEAKIFFLDLQENQRGRYFKVTEDAHGRRNTIIIPSESATLVLEAVNRLIAENAARPTGVNGVSV